MTEQQTQDPNQQQGTGQQEEGPSVEERLSQLEAQRKEDAKKLEEERAARLKAEETSRKLQASRDRERARLEKLQQRQATQSPRQSGQSSVDELRAFANEKGKEAMLYRELSNAKMTEEEFEELSGVLIDDLATPAEIRSAIQLASINKRIAEQDQRLDEALSEVEKQKKGAEEHMQKPEGEHEPAATSGGGVDTGGPTGIVPATDQSSPEALRARAEEIKKATPYNDEELKKARYLVLDAAHADPSKTMGRGRGGPTQEG